MPTLSQGRAERTDPLFASDDSAHPPWCTCCTCNPDDAVDRAVELAVRPPRLTSAPLPLAEVLASLPLTERPVS